MHVTMTENGRRSVEVEFRGKRYRVTEAPPSRGYRVLSMCEAMVGPIILQILSGTLVDKRNTPCPTCGGADPQAVGKDKWLCTVVVEQNGPVVKCCGTMWDQESEVDERGKPIRVTLAHALSSPRWMALLGIETNRALKRLTPDAAEEFMHETLLGNLEVHIAGTEWFTINTVSELDHHIPTASVLKRLVNAAMEAWILPMAADGWSTRQDSSAEKTDGDSPAPTMSTKPRIPGPPPTQVSG